MGGNGRCVTGTTNPPNLSHAGDPSAGALNVLRDSFTFTSQSRRLRLASVSAALLLAVVLAVATVVSLLTTRAQRMPCSVRTVQPVAKRKPCSALERQKAKSRTR